jgi:centrosomal protein CEP164
VDSAVLEEDFDPLYEPSPAEIEEYAVFLGMDTTEDEALMWIAREGLKAPLPEPWRTCKTEDGSGKVYYFNFDSGESIWEHPCDLQYKKLFADEKVKLAEQVRVDAKAEKKEKKERVSPYCHDL